LGFPTGWSFTTHKETSGAITHTPSAKFSGAVAGEKWKTSARGVFAHTSFTLFYCFALFYLFYLHHFISKTQKN
jgi:hypothetical protein